MAESKIDILRERIDNIIDPEEIMIEILDIFDKTELVPNVGNYYTFVYRPKTPNIVYDQHPLVAVTSIERWGFNGINFHWGQSRRYTWQEIIGKLHIVQNDEIIELRNIKYAKFDKT